MVSLQASLFDVDLSPTPLASVAPIAPAIPPDRKSVV